jgi:hypothetical protein
VAHLKRRIAARLRKQAKMPPSAALSPGSVQPREAVLLTPHVALATLPNHPLGAIASHLNPLRAETLRLRRSARGAHVYVEQEDELIGEGGLGFEDGDTVFVERGPALHTGEVLVRCAWCIPESVTSQESTAGGAEGGRHPSPPGGSADPTGCVPEERDSRRRTRRSVSWAEASQVSVLGADEAFDAEVASFASSSRSRSRSPRSRSRSQSPSTASDSYMSGYSSAASSVASDDNDAGGTAAACEYQVAEAFQGRVQAQPCALVAVPETLPILQLKRRLRRALAATGSHPPYQPTARMSLSVPAARMRLYSKRGATAGAPLRDDEEVGAALSAGSHDKEVALQIVPQEERLSEDALLLGLMVLQADASVAHTSAVVIRKTWHATKLLDHLAEIGGIPRLQAAIARAPKPGTLTPHQLGQLRWDDETLISCSMVSLQLSDGDVLVLRDRAFPPPQPPPRSTPQRTNRPVGVRFGDAATRSGSSSTQRPNDGGIHIRGPRFIS